MNASKIESCSISLWCSQRIGNKNVLNLTPWFVLRLNVCASLLIWRFWQNDCRDLESVVLKFRAHVCVCFRIVIEIIHRVFANWNRRWSAYWVHRVGFLRSSLSRSSASSFGPIHRIFCCFPVEWNGYCFVDDFCIWKRQVTNWIIKQTSRQSRRWKAFNECAIIVTISHNWDCLVLMMLHHLVA